MRKVITIIGETVLAALIIVFLLNFIFHGAFFDKVSKVPTKEQNDSNKHEIAKDDSITEKIELKYNGTIYTTDVETDMKSMFEVKVGDKDFMPGNTENGFSLYIEDIQNQKGDSLMEQAEDSIVEGSDEITVPLSYNEESGKVTFYQSGIYKIVVRIYGENGGTVRKTVSIPVEVN